MIHMVVKFLRIALVGSQCIITDNGTVQKLQGLHTQDRQVWYEIRNCEGDTTSRMVRYLSTTCF